MPLPDPATRFAAEMELQQQAEQAAAEHRIETARAALRIDPSDVNARYAAASALEKLRRTEDALAILREGMRTGCPALLHQKYIGALEQLNRTEEAIAHARLVEPGYPENDIFRFRANLLLPVLYPSEADMLHWRARYAEGLARLHRETTLDTEPNRSAAFAGLRDYSNVLLTYQGLNDRDLQIEWGRLAHRIMAAARPRWMAPRRMSPVLPGEPLRIGYVSSRFNEGSACRFFLGWLREHDRSRVSVHSWYVGFRPDQVTDEVRRVSDRFDYCPDLLDETCLSIRERNLHALIFLDIGIEPLTTQLAALRLAPLQGMAWDHPVTSGLPNMDFALTSGLSEPPDGDSHYSEKLVRLPGVGVSYRCPVIPVPLLRRTRGDFGLRDDAVVYLCCQSIFKFLPRNDEVFAGIARRIPNAQFAFVSPNDALASELLTRLDAAFRAVGLSARDHCTVLPHLNHFDYWNLHLVGDIFLDTIGWSSGGSVFEAIACRVPVVTRTGEVMRARQGAAILTQLGVTETIAQTNPEYIDIAARLGADPALRRDLAMRMQRGGALLYSDSRGVRALEDFLIHEIHSRV